MLLNKRNKQIAIMLAGMGVAMLSMFLQWKFQTFYAAVRALMVVGTTIGLTGILKEKDPQQRDKFVVVWMCLTGVLFFAYSFSFMQYFLEMFERSNLNALPIFLGTAVATGLLGYLIACIYEDLQELREDNFPANSDTSNLLNSPEKEALHSSDSLRVTVST